MSNTFEIVEVQDIDVKENSIYVVVDTFAFSTTVTTALDNTSIDAVHTEMNFQELKEKSFPTGGEDPIDSPVMNSPLPFKNTKYESDKVGLTSDNGAKRVHQLLNKGANAVALGCLRNAVSVGMKLREDDRDAYIVNADSHNTPVIEDYFTSTIISNISRGYDYNEDEIESIREKGRSCMDTDQRSDRLEFCLEFDKTDTIPLTNNGVFTSWN